MRLHSPAPGRASSPSSISAAVSRRMHQQVSQRSINTGGHARRRRQDVVRHAGDQTRASHAASRPSAVIRGRTTRRSRGARRQLRLQGEQRQFGRIARRQRWRREAGPAVEGRARSTAHLMAEPQRLERIVRHQQHGAAGQQPAPRSCSASRVIASSWANGSSISTTGRSSHSVRASATRWRMPPDSVAGRSPPPARPTSPAAVRARSGAAQGDRVAAQAIAQHDIVQHAEPRQQQVGAAPSRRRDQHRRRVPGSRPASQRSSEVLPTPLGPAGRSSGRRETRASGVGHDAVAESDTCVTDEESGGAGRRWIDRRSHAAFICGATAATASDFDSSCLTKSYRRLYVCAMASSTLIAGRLSRRLFFRSPLAVAAFAPARAQDADIKFEHSSLVIDTGGRELKFQVELALNNSQRARVDVPRKARTL